MNDHNSIIEKLVNLAGEKRILTFSAINDALPTEFNLEELDDLLLSILDMGIQIEDYDTTRKSKAKTVTNNQDIKTRNAISRQTLESNKSEKDILISNYVDLVSNIVDEYQEKKPSTIGEKDLIQEGYLGLLTAATDYKSNEEENFSTFASKRIRDFIITAIENEKRLGNISLEDFDKEQEFIWYWKDDEEDIYATKFNDHSKSIDEDRSELTLTSISKVQVPHIPDLDKVNPTLTSYDTSILLEKKISESKEFRTSRLNHPKSLVIDSLSVAEEDFSDSLNEPLPKVYSKTRFDNDRRLSLYAKLVGERAEKIVIKYLADTLMPSESASIRWIAKSGETPGWDIEYYDTDNNMVAIEVKGTNGKYFPNIEITGNEWNAAIELQDQYWIYLVSGCLGIDPKIQKLQNPFKLKESGALRITPILWRIEMISSNISS